MSIHFANSPDVRRARVVGAREGLVTIATDAPIVKNEIGFIIEGEERLQGEVLRVRENHADMQVFEDTARVAVGHEVELSGQMLSVTLGPGLLGQVFDGLQNPLDRLASEHGFFLPRGRSIAGLDPDQTFHFDPAISAGDRARAGTPVGSVPESGLRHLIMVPFNEAHTLTVSWVRRRERVSANEPVARLRRPDGSTLTVGLQQRWPVRVPLAETMLRQAIARREYPRELLTTTQRIIDTFYPVALGGTACIPGPFGAGKTVLQNLIAKHAQVDVVVIIACGERAGEVVETITEYPHIEDPRTGSALMDRAIIVCNTSSMPVAAREASIYTGITLGEYYRQMGYHVLSIADSTSRWAQAMRETSGRMEEIPGEEAFPAYLDSTIKSVYERAGVVACDKHRRGSLTLIGTVSPAGGNFEEPVTQATLATVKTFLGLSSDRAYRRCYPAIDPLISWSRYFEQLGNWLGEHQGTSWVEDVKEMQALLHRADAIQQMMQVTGEEGITLEDYVLWQKARFLDSAYLQQDAFDAVDASMPLARQRRSFERVVRLVRRQYAFSDREQAREFFARLMALYRNLNYSEEASPDYARFEGEIEALAAGADSHSARQETVGSERV